MREEAEFGGLLKRREVNDKVTSAKDPPTYGAQHRQVGKEAMRRSLLGGNRPLPGVRLDEPGYLVVSGCEWHISPHGRSYFVYHNTRTTSWKKPIPERPAGSLTPECIIEGHSSRIWSLACVGPSYISASEHGSIRQWRRNGEPTGEPWRSDGGGVGSIAVSPDETMVVSGSGDGRLRLWNVKEGSVVGDPWEGHEHNVPVRCLDWSLSAGEIASGSEDGTVRRWNPDTGQQIGLTNPIESGHGWVLAVKYSPQGDKLASGGSDDMIRIWSKSDGELLIEINGLCWSKDGAYIFSGSSDRTIRKWRSIDGKEVFVLQGHTNFIRSICVSPDEQLLVGASADYSLRVWNLKTNHQVGHSLLHDDELKALAISSDGQYVASAGLDKKICVWSLEAALKRGSDQLAISPPSKQRVRNKDFVRYGGDFWGNDTNRTPHDSALLTSPPPSTTASSGVKTRLRILSNWWPIHTGRASPPTVDIPLAQGKKRNAAAGAPRGDGGYMRDEDFDSRPPSPTRNPNSQQPSTVVQTNVGEHGSGRLCFCL